METTTNLGQVGYKASDLDADQFAANAEHRGTASYYDPNTKEYTTQDLYTTDGKDPNVPHGSFMGGWDGQPAFQWCSGDYPCEFYHYAVGKDADLPKGQEDGYKLWKASCEAAGCPGYYKVYTDDCEPSNYVGFDDKTYAKCTLHFYCMISGTDEMGNDC